MKWRACCAPATPYHGPLQLLVRRLARRYFADLIAHGSRTFSERLKLPFDEEAIRKACANNKEKTHFDAKEGRPLEKAAEPNAREITKGVRPQPKVEERRNEPGHRLFEPPQSSRRSRYTVEHDNRRSNNARSRALIREKAQWSA
jgi:hypothetical protein